MSFAMYPDIAYMYVPKVIYLEKQKKKVIWDGRSTFVCSTCFMFWKTIINKKKNAESHC